MANDNPCVVHSVDQLIASVKSCRDCCNGDYISFHCPLCPPSKFKPTRKRKVESHMRAVHWKSRVEGCTGQYAVLCHLPQHSHSRHYHCTSCSRTIARKQNAVHHMQICQRMVPETTSECTLRIQRRPIAEDSLQQDHQYTVLVDKNSNLRRESQPSNINMTTQNPSHRVTCGICQKMVSAKWLNSHMKRHQSGRHDINRDNHHHTVTVDHSNGIYCSSSRISGPQIPIHLQKVTNALNPISCCEHKTCIDLKAAAARGGNHSFECDHLRSVPYSVPGREVDLRLDSLTAMLNQKFLTQARYNELQIFKQRAEKDKCPFVVYLPQQPNSSSPRYVLLSVYTGRTRFWSRLQRTVVRYDIKRNTLTCGCTQSKRTCPHKLIGKWYLRQEQPELVSSEQQPMSDDDDFEETATQELNVHFTSGPKLSHMRYYKSPDKKIPSNIADDLRRITVDKSKFTNILPKEANCEQCQGPLDIHLASKRGKIVSLQSVLKDVTVYNKVCPPCQLVYRYQEWREGIHNFNDVLFLGLDVCHFIRSGLKNHVAIGRSVAVLEEMVGESLQIHTIQQAYLHFEAMTDHDYSFHCVVCGHHPPILIFDTCRKIAFRHAVSELQVPSGEVSDTVDVRRFWSTVEAEITGWDHMKGVRKFVPSYEFWSPWIGEKSRDGDLAFNTEVKKVASSSGEDNVDSANEPIPEEVLVNMLSDEKVTAIRRVCREVGVVASGSSVDMIKRLRDMSISRGDFDNAYEKLFGCSGGWAVGCCHHGVVYAIKSLLRSESCRDYLDLERSLKHRPNVTICDVAYLLARQANRIIPDFYTPNEGRLASDTEDNILKAEMGELDCTAEFLVNPEFDPNCQNSNKNPVTGSEKHYALLDWFHQENCKSKKEILRRSSLLPQLCGIVDTQAVEQLFSSLKRDIYFLNNMSPVRHMFLFRFVVHLRNQKRNVELLRKHTYCFRDDWFFNDLGQVCQKCIHPTIQVTDDTTDTMLNPEVVVEWDLNSEMVSEPFHREDHSSKQDHEESNGTVSLLQNSINTLSASVHNIKTLVDKVQQIMQNRSALNSQDMQHLYANVNYANNVLFREAAESRRNQVRTMASPHGDFQVQGASNYCGLCCLNNVIGPTDGVFPISISDMDAMADKLWLDMVNNPALGLTVLLEPLRDREGYYSFEVLQGTAITQGYHLLHINPSTVSHLNTEEAFQQVCDPGTGIKLIVRLQTSEHWVSLKSNDCSNIFLLDSKETSGKPVSPEFVGSFILENVRPPGAVCLLRSMEWTPVEGVSPLPENVVDKVITSSGPHIHSIEAYDDNHSDIEDVNYYLRTNPKKKRPSSSWICDFPSKTRRHCVCDKQDDGRLYWQCDECKQWFHPACLGVDEEDEEDTFICPKCWTKKPKEKRKTKKAIRNIPKQVTDTQQLTEEQVLNEELPKFSISDLQIRNIIPFADEEDEEAVMLVCVPEIIHQVDVIDKYVEELITDRDTNRTDNSQVGIFMGNPGYEFLHGFGLGYVSDVANVYFDAYILKKFFRLRLRDPRRPATSGHVHKLALLPGSERLQRVLQIEGYEAAIRQRRCREALVRDVKILLVSSKFGLSAEEARRRCSETEDRSLFKAVQKGEQLRAERST